MKELQNKIRELFEQNEIDVLLGWIFNKTFQDVRPYLFKKDDDLNQVIFDDKCVHNLTNYLPTITDRYNKIGIVLKGCDGRALVTQIVEHRIHKSKVIALAVACDGVKIDGKEANKCSDCPTNISPIADYSFGEPKKETNPEFKQLADIEKLSTEERWEFFAGYFEKCTRCYACRQICPLCYCEQCVSDQLEPQWIEPSAKLSSNTMWNLTRAYHLAGRCADCGECDRVCPENIPLRLLNNAMEKTVLEMFKMRPGTVPDELPPLVTLSMEDPDEILGGKK